MLVNQEQWEISNLEITNYGLEQKVGEQYLEPYTRAGIYVYTYDQEHIKDGFKITNCYVHDVVSNITPKVVGTSPKMSGGIIILAEHRAPDNSESLLASNENITAGFKNGEISHNSVQEVIRNKPVLDFTIMSGANTISELGGTATLTIPYTLALDEDPNAMIIYFINSKDELQVVKNGIYDNKTSTISF